MVSAGQQLGNAVTQQNFSALQATLLPAVAPQWESIREVIEQGAPVVKGGQVQLNALYQLDATSLTSPADTQFFCSNSNGSLTVTISMRALPPGKYAVILAYVLGAPAPGQAPPASVGQLAFILGLEGNCLEAGRRLPPPRHDLTRTTASGGGSARASWLNRTRHGPPISPTTRPATCYCR